MVDDQFNELIALCRDTSMKLIMCRIKAAQYLNKRKKKNRKVRRFDLQRQCLLIDHLVLVYFLYNIWNIEMTILQSYLKELCLKLFIWKCVSRCPIHRNKYKWLHVNTSKPQYSAYIYVQLARAFALYRAEYVIQSQNMCAYTIVLEYTG